MSAFRKVWPLLIAAIALGGCKPLAETLNPDLPNKPLTCGGAECEVYMVRRYEKRPSFYERGFDGKTYQMEGFRMVLETATVRLTLTCGQQANLPPPPACGQGMLLAGETVWARKGPSGQTLYVYNNETPQHEQIVSPWMIDSSEAK